MTITFWPNRSRADILRFSLLLTALGAVVFFAIQIYSVDFVPVVGSGETFVRAWIFERLLGKTASNTAGQVELDSLYARSLGDEVSIAAKAKQFYRDRGSAPLSFKELNRFGLVAADQIDPWKRPYQMHVLEGRVLVVQSTGPSGKNAIDWNHPEAVEGLLDSKFRMVGDNLLVVTRLTSSESKRTQPVPPGL